MIERTHSLIRVKLPRKEMEELLDQIRHKDCEECQERAEKEYLPKFLASRFSRDPILSEKIAYHHVWVLTRNARYYCLTCNKFICDEHLWLNHEKHKIVDCSSYVPNIRKPLIKLPPRPIRKITTRIEGNTIYIKETVYSDTEL